MASNGFPVLVWLYLNSDPDPDQNQDQDPDTDPDPDQDSDPDQVGGLIGHKFWVLLVQLFVHLFVHLVSRLLFSLTLLQSYFSLTIALAQLHGVPVPALTPASYSQPLSASPSSTQSVSHLFIQLVPIFLLRPY